jgi:UDP-N-acetylmuramoyl-L-alanyl-D-glutamate--2,6-diaminopimelate ligase
MKELRDILYRVPLTSTYGNMQVEVSGLSFDSRKVKKGDVFIAVNGHASDGHQFIDKAIDSGT